MFYCVRCGFITKFLTSICPQCNGNMRRKPHLEGLPDMLLLLCNKCNSVLIVEPNNEQMDEIRVNPCFECLKNEGDERAELGYEEGYNDGATEKKIREKSKQLP